MDMPGPTAAAAEPDALALLASKSPDLPMPEVATLVEIAYGLRGRATPLHGERDQNVLIEVDDDRRFVFRLFHAAQDEEGAAFQSRALLHLRHAVPDLPVPRVVATRSGTAEGRFETENGTVRLGRLETFLPGRPLLDEPRGPSQAEALGRLAAALDGALGPLARPSRPQLLLWDLAHAADVIRLIPDVEDEAERRLAATALDVFRREALPRLPALPAQAIHGDLNPGNVLVGPTGTLGIIDFGDLSWSARVNEVAVAAAYLLGHGEDSLGLVRELVAVYHRLQPLAPEEIDLLPPLVATRLAMTTVISAWRARRFPESAGYLLRNRARAVAGLTMLAEGGSRRLADRLSRACRARA